MTEIVEHRAVKILGVMDCDVSGNAIAIDNIFSEELFDGCGADVCDRLNLNPLCEVLDCHNGDGVITLCWG
jgi:hypothetical protein